MTSSPVSDVTLTQEGFGIERDSGSQLAGGQGMIMGCGNQPEGDSLKETIVVFFWRGSFPSLIL